MKERIMTAVATKKKGKRIRKKRPMLKKIANICGYEGHISQRYSICPKKLMYSFYDSRTHIKCVKFRTKGKRDFLYISKKVIVFSIWL